MGFYKFYTIPILLCIIVNFGAFISHSEANTTNLLTEIEFSKAGSDDMTKRKLIGVWDLTRIDGKPATDMFTTEFKMDGTYYVTTLPCRKEKGTWRATRETITATVTHSPGCIKNVGRKYSDQFSLYGHILIVYVFDERNKKHAYTFRKRTVFLKT